MRCRSSCVDFSWLRSGFAVASQEPGQGDVHGKCTMMCTGSARGHDLCEMVQKKAIGLKRKKDKCLQVGYTYPIFRITMIDVIVMMIFTRLDRVGDLHRRVLWQGMILAFFGYRKF